LEYAPELVQEHGRGGGRGVSEKGRFDIVMPMQGGPGGAKRYKEKKEASEE
jgi:hypothetical protein